MQMPMMSGTRGWGTQTWNTSNARKMADKATSAKMPAPWAVLGMVAAFAGGTVLGMLGGKKSAMQSTGSGGWPMAKHHHHGFGQGACRQKHGQGGPAAPGAWGEQSDRDEGE